MLEQEIPNPILPKSFQSIWKNLWQALHWSLTSEYLKVAPLYGSFRFPAVVTTIFVRICTQWEILAAVFKFKPQHQQRWTYNGFQQAELTVGSTGPIQLKVIALYFCK